MGEVIQPEDMSTWMRDVERRLRGVESGAKLLTVQYSRLRQTQTYVAVTSAGFTSCWEIPISRIVNDALQVGITVTADANTNGECQVYAFSSPGGVLNGLATASITITGGATGAQKYMEWDWQVPGMDALLGGGGGTIFQIRAKRTSGTGNINVYDPDLAMQCSAFSIGATSTGI